MMDEDKTREQLLAELAAARRQVADLTDKQHQLEERYSQVITAEQEQRALATALRETGAALSSSLKGEEVLDRILEQLDQVVPHDAACVLLIDDSITRVFRWRGYVGTGRTSPAEIAAAAFNLDNIPVLGEARATGRPLLVSRPPATDEWVRKFGKRWVKSYACAPIRSRGQIIGFLTIDSATPGFFKSSHLEPLQAFAQQTALALENVRLYDLARRERVKRVKALKEELDFMTAVLDRTEAPVVVLDQEGRIVRLNRAGEQLSGYRLAEAWGHYFWELLLTPEEMPAFKTLFNEGVANREMVNGEFYLLTRSGDRRLISWSGTVLLDRAGPGQHMVLTGLDLTEQRQAEMTLRESEGRYRRLIEVLPDGIVVQREGKIVLVNPAGAEIMGAKSPEQLIGKAAIEFMHPDYRRIAARRILQALEAGETSPYLEEKLLRLDGTPVDVQLMTTAFIYEDQPAILTVIRDITERKGAEASRPPSTTGNN